MGMRHIAICGLPLYNIVSRYFIIGTTFGESGGSF
jgi:hypothetical protein